MHLEDIAIGSIEPCDDDDVVTGGKARERRGKHRSHLDPRVGCALRPLSRCIVEGSQRGANMADDAKV